MTVTPPPATSQPEPEPEPKDARRRSWEVAGGMLRETARQGGFLRQNALAEKMGVKEPRVSEIFSGSRRANEEFIDNLLDKSMPGDSVGAERRKQEILDVYRRGENGEWTEPPKGEQPPPPSVTAERRRWRPSGLVVGLVVVVGLLAAGGVGAYFLSNGTCGSDAVSIEGQCIGYTDGSTNIAQNMNPTFTDILRKIHDENDRAVADAAAAGGPIVSVAYTAPFPRPDAIDPSAAPLASQLTRELQGAYLVQLRANGRGGTEGLSGSPRVRLLIANLGDQRSQSIPADAGEDDRRSAERTQRDMIIESTGGLIALSKSETAPLVATVGFDQSFKGVADAIGVLGEQKIPMVAARLTADVIADNAYRNGFYAVSPSIKAQVAAASRYLGSQARKPMIVADQSQDDLYGEGIFDQLQPTLPANPATGRALLPERYDSSKPNVETTFQQMTTSICSKAPDTIYFAGRGAQLVSFIRALGDRACQTQPFTVFTPSDGRLLAEQIRAENDTNGALATALRDRGIRVQLTAQAHPDEWAFKPDLFPPPTYENLIPPDNTTYSNAQKQCDTCYATLFPNGSVQDDGDVIMGHDAMLVAVSAIRAGVSQQDPTVNAGTVSQQLTRFTPAPGNPVRGASGPIGYDGAGFPVNKDIPFTQITAEGRITLVRP